MNNAITLIGIGLLGVLSVTLLYAISETVCEMIVKQFDMKVNTYYRYSELEEESRLQVDYTGVVVSYVIGVAFCILLTCLVLYGIGEVILRVIEYQRYYILYLNLYTIG